MAKQAAFSYKPYLTPRYLPTLFGVFMLFLLSRLPRATQISLGRKLGTLVEKLLPNRRRVADINLKLAFPELSKAERKTLRHKSFQHTGISLMDTACVWFRPPEFYMDQFQVKGLEHVEAAKALGKGVLIIQAHFTILEPSAPVIGLKMHVSIVTETPKNPLVGALLKHHRERFVEETIDRSNIRKMIRRLRKNEAVWYAPDLFVHPRHGGIQTNYFGVPALTTDGIARIRRLTGAAVVPYIPTRNADGTATMELFPALKNFDAQDIPAETQAMNDLFESQVRQFPDQYLWVHRRFKTVQGGTSDPYHS